MRMTHAFAILRRFLRSTRGSVSAEAVLVLPMVLWAYLATYEYFDAYGTITRNMKATYTLADIISRQTSTVTPNYIAGLNSLYTYLDRNPTGTWTRVTSIGWSATPDVNGYHYYVMWSGVSNGDTSLQLQDETLQSFVPRLPNITEGDTLIMVETHMNYQPSFSIVGLQDQVFTQTVITRPRISAQVAWDDGSS